MEFNTVFGAVLLYLVPAAVYKRPNYITPYGAYTRKAFNARTPRYTHKYGFGSVVKVVSYGYFSVFRLAQGSFKGVVAYKPACLLCTYSLFLRNRRNVVPFAYNRYVKPGAKSLYEPLIAVAFLTPQAVVYVYGGNAYAEPVLKAVQNMDKGAGIGTAGKTDNDFVTGAEHIIFRYCI